VIDLDKDIDKMQAIILGECPYCRVMNDEKEYNHDSMCPNYVTWAVSRDRLGFIEKYTLRGESIRAEIRYARRHR